MGQGEEGKGGQMVTEGDLALGGEHMIQHTDDVLQKCTSETRVILLTNVTPINSIKIFLKKKMSFKSFPHFHI